MDKNYLSDEGREKYKQCLVKWQNKLGLVDWRFNLREQKSPGAMADVNPNYQARLAIFRLGDWKASPQTELEIEKTACHESLHVFLAELIELVQAESKQHCIDSAEHRIINILESLLVNPH